MANGYKTGNPGASFSGGYHNPQPVEFSGGSGGSTEVLAAEKGVAEGLSTIAVNGTFRDENDHVDKGT
jgi:hypothetical protein